MPAGCQDRTRLVPNVATQSICLCLLPLRRDPGFHPGDAGTSSERCRIMRQSVWHSGLFCTAYALAADGPIVIASLVATATTERGRQPDVTNLAPRLNRRRVAVRADCSGDGR